MVALNDLDQTIEETHDAYREHITQAKRSITGVDSESCNQRRLLGEILKSCPASPAEILYAEILSQEDTEVDVDPIDKYSPHKRDV